MLRKVTNSLYENILCLTLKWFTINKRLYSVVGDKEKRAEIVWFGFSSPRGAFRLKTTLMLMVDTNIYRDWADYVYIGMGHSSNQTTNFFLNEQIDQNEQFKIFRTISIFHELFLNRSFE